MRPEDWERAEEWFHRLAPLDVAERSERLEEVSASDPDLAGDVRSLLSAHDSEGLLDRLTAKLAPEAPGAGLSVAPLTGASITHYEVGKLVGRGGMGDVYRARDTRLDREVALKFLPAWLGRDPTARDRFLVEARIVSSLDHPNVCTLYDIGETDDGRLFLVMPYYEGETLKQRLKKGPLSDDEALDVALQLARGLAAAHERGIVHRDVKPGNLLLAADGRVKILDFGVAKLADVSLTRPGETPGTASYMAPEQSAGASVDARTDLWALGAAMYEMLTGARPAGPIEPESDGSGAMAEGLGGMPRGLAETVARLLAARPDERYPDARALIDDLEILAGAAGSLSPGPAPSLQRFLAELKRRHVFRVAAVYGVAGFAVIEVADMVFPRIPLPEWTVSLVVWLVLLGFPIALVLAWAFEMAPGGVRRTRSTRPAVLDAIVAQPAMSRWPIGVAGLIGGALIVVGASLALDRGAVSRLGLASRAEPPAPAVTQRQRPSLAVLPFRDLTRTEGTRSFADGIHGDLLTQLYKLGSLKVISRTSVLEYRDSPKNVREIARELGAESLLEGHVQQIGDRFRINVQLIDADTDSQLWAEAYEGELSVAEVFSVQARIATSVAEALAAELTPDERAGLRRVPTRDRRAYEAYQAASDLTYTLIEAGGPATMQTIDRLLSDAIARDSGFAEAYALKSAVASLSYLFAYDRSPSTIVAADTLSKRALDLAPNLPDGHWARAMYHFRTQLDYDRALHHMELALREQPGDVVYLRQVGYILRRQGEVRESLDLFLRAAELDPRGGLGAANVGRTYMLLREYGKARTWLLKARDLRPERGTTYHELSFLEVQEDGDTAGARSWLDEARRLGIYNPRLDFGYPEAAMLERRPREAIRAIESWPDTVNSNQFQYVHRDLAMAFAHRLAGDSLAARTHFERAHGVLAWGVEATPSDARLRSALGLALAGLGRTEEAIREAEEAVRLMPPEREFWVGGRRVRDLAEIYAMSGRTGEAIERLEYLLSIPWGDVSTALLRLDPTWDPLRGDPRFQALTSDS